MNKRYFTEAFAIKNAVSGLFGFLVSIACGALLSHIQENGNTFLGIHVYGQQVLAALSLLFGIAALLYSRIVLSRLPVLNIPADLEQNSEPQTSEAAS